MESITQARTEPVVRDRSRPTAASIETDIPFRLDRLPWTRFHWLLWAVTFFSASAAASAGYLTVSEIFPLEMRALAIALFYSVGTAVGGLGAPALFGRLIDSGRAEVLFWGYVAGAGLMIVAAAVELILGVDSERKSLEDVASPLTADCGT
jgi:MFS family permease